MNKMKKISAMLIAIAMMATSMSACAAEKEESSESSKSQSSESSKSESSTEESSEAEAEMVGNIYVSGLPIAKDPVTYQIMNVHGANDKSTSQNDKPIMAIAEEGTNVKINWTESVDGALGEQLNLLLTTGTGLPDAIHGGVNDSQIFQNASKFYTFSEDTLQKFAPNLTSGFEEYVDGGLDALKKADGVIYSLPTGVWSEYAAEPSAVTIINTKYLKDAGIEEVPTTVEGLYDAMLAIKDTDYNGNGTADEIPYIFAQSNWAAKIQAMANAWGIAGKNLNNDMWYGRIEDGVYSTNITEDRFKDFLIEMNRWYQAGLIPGDGFSMTGAEFNSLQNTNVHAMVTTWCSPSDNREDWTYLPVLTAKGYEGQELKSGQAGMRCAVMNGFTITSVCKEPEGLIRWWDNLHKDAETKRLARDGEEGFVYVNNEDGTATVTTSSGNYPKGVTSDTEYIYSYGWRGNCPAMFGDDLAIPDRSEVTDDSLRFDYADYYGDYYAKEFLPDFAAPAEYVEEFAFVKTEIETYVDSFMAQSVVNGLTDEQWNKFLSDLEGYGIDEWVKFYQSYVSNSWE